MKVLMLGWEYPPFNSGGLGVACQYLCEALVRKGVSVSILLPWRFKTPSAQINFLFANDEILVAEYKPFLSGYLTPEEYSRLKDEEKLLLEQDLFTKVKNYARRAAEIVKKTSFQIYHAHDWLTFRAGVAVKSSCPRPLVAHVHSTEFDRSGGISWGNPFCRAEEQMMMEASDAVIAVSNYTKNILQKEYGVNPEKITVIHNGIDLSRFRVTSSSLQSLSGLKKSGNKIVLYVGRFTLHKGIEYFIRSAAQVCGIYPKVYFLLVGSGEQEKELVRLVARLGISDRVLFTGFLRGEQLNQVYSLADLFVLPSVSEPFGMTALEALSHRTPVILSKQSGVSEVVPNSLRVDFWDVRELTNKIVAVLKHEPLKECLAENGLKDAQKNTWDKAAEKCKRLYESLSFRRKACFAR